MRSEEEIRERYNEINDIGKADMLPKEYIKRKIIELKTLKWVLEE